MHVLLLQAQTQQNHPLLRFYQPTSSFLDILESIIIILTLPH